MELDSKVVEDLHALQETLQRLQSGAAGSGQSAALQQSAEDLIYEIERELTDLQPQVRHLPYQDKVDTSKRLEQHRARVRASQEQLERFRLNAQPAAGGVNLAAMNRRDRQAYKQERDRLLVAKGMIDDDDSSLQRTMNTIEETAQVGMMTQVELQEQRESMLRSQGALNESNDFLVRSRNTLRRMRRRLMTNKLLWFVIIVVELLIIALIIWLKFFN